VLRLKVYRKVISKRLQPSKAQTTRYYCSKLLELLPLIDFNRLIISEWRHSISPLIFLNNSPTNVTIFVADLWGKFPVRAASWNRERPVPSGRPRVSCEQTRTTALSFPIAVTTGTEKSLATVNPDRSWSLAYMQEHCDSDVPFPAGHLVQILQFSSACFQRTTVHRRLRPPVPSYEGLV